MTTIRRYSRTGEADLCCFNPVNYNSGRDRLAFVFDGGYTESMVLAHSIIGIATGNYLGHFWYVLAGSVFPDIDHLFVIVRHKIFTPAKILDCLRFEKKYHLAFKTKYVHSILGAVMCSLPILLIDITGAGYFFLGYLGHLVLDYPDYDEKQYLYPLKVKFQGSWPIFSTKELIFTLGLMIWLVLSYY